MQNQDTVVNRPTIVLPDAPVDLVGPVKVWSQPVEILTYLPEQPDKNPMFLEKRVYQGSSGRVYPLPFIDRIATLPIIRKWQAVHIENDYLRVMILPEIGGRIHIGLDKTTGYDFFYRQNVIKPALVGLAGPWLSGGVEFNWPQHHRPATFMPVEVNIQHDDDGSATVWCSDHDPMLHIKGMHGICLAPDRAVLELKVRLFNRTPYTQSFLWWANAAVRVHQQYQSFFPPDVCYVADHARRAITTFPRSKVTYYGVDYPARAARGVPTEEAPRFFVPDGSYPADDLRWFSNIPVPTSYMITSSNGDFLGGYDHTADAGLVHVANHHIAPGKKQWTWGNQEFGYAWDRSLTDHDGPYVELMAGAYTDNQPDFSWLAPYETKSFIQSWFPIRTIGVPEASNVDAALSVHCSDHVATIGLYVTRNFREVTITLRTGGTVLAQWHEAVTIKLPFLRVISLDEAVEEEALGVTVIHAGQVLIEYIPNLKKVTKAPTAAVEPLPPADIQTVEELYLTGLHLHQYRHATRLPESYWREALRRDPSDSRSNNAIGLWHLKRGEFAAASKHFRIAIDRLVYLNPNPQDGEPYYNLGVCERLAGDNTTAYDALYKATWSASWRAPAYLALAEIDACRGDWPIALDHVRRSLLSESENLVALNLLVTTLRRLGRHEEAEQLQHKNRLLDPLDLGSRWIDHIPPANGQERLDLAFDLLRSGQKIEAANVIRSKGSADVPGSLPIELFMLACIEEELGSIDAQPIWKQAASASVAYCFPSRLEEFTLLHSVAASHPDLASPHFLLGNFLYDCRRHKEAMRRWETAALLNPDLATVWRNLGIGRFNILGDRTGALAAFDRALLVDPSDARILYERDQLWKRVGEHPERRLSALNEYRHLVLQRDDLCVEMATLLNQVGRPAETLDLVLNRHFQPWEGGEGLVLAQYTRASILLAREALHSGEAEVALEFLHKAVHPPENLSEARHLLANQSDLFYWLGIAYQALEDLPRATAWWERAAHNRGDFLQMAIRNVSPMTFWSALALQRMACHEEAKLVFREILDYTHTLEVTVPSIDYFATSLPAMLLFEDDLVQRKRIDVLFFRAQAVTGFGRITDAANLLHELLQIDINHAGAADLLRYLHEDSSEVRS